MRDAQHGEFNILLAEALDRINRDQADVAHLYKHLKFAGVTIVTLAEGEITELHVGLKGTMDLRVSLIHGHLFQQYADSHYGNSRTAISVMCGQFARVFAGADCA